MPTRPKAVPVDDLLRLAFGAAAGAALVLDAELRVVLASEPAVQLFGGEIPLGAAAAKVLCVNSPKRQLAAALVAGKNIDTVIPHPAVDAGERTIQVRSIALRRGSGLVGFILLLHEGASASDEPTLFHGMWTRSVKLREVFRIIRRVAPEDITVLVRGETGTGKELVAAALHAESPRARGPFRALNCAALPPTLLESELFGHVRGAFTGAVRNKQGHFELAHRGTLFLDEIGELPLELQAKLLRVLETKTVLPVGGRNPVPVDVRIVSATHRALRQEVAAGRFRADLMYRLRVVTIFLPALRERREDIALLCERLIGELNRSQRRRVERISPQALSSLESYDWPGNIRELQNALVCAYAMGDGPLLQPSDLPAEITAEQSAFASRPPPPDDPHAHAIVEALTRTRGNKNNAAKLLGMSRVTLWRRMRQLGLLADET
jgi:transcriptional regulator with PAS, ATPase and Fis domain